MSWDQIPLHADLLDAVKQSFGFPEPTLVQAESIPPFLKHKDVVVEAVTGSGKTLAYLLPVLQMVYCPNGTFTTSAGIKAIIIAPTRELAAQIDFVVRKFTVALPRISHALLIGGTEIQRDLQTLSQSPNLLIATPGRLDDLLSSHRGLFDGLNSHLEVLILDEADRLLDLGFSAALTRIISALPKQRRTGLFSATMNDALDELIRTGLRNPHRVSVSRPDLRTPSTLSVRYITAWQDERLEILLHILNAVGQDCKTIVYFATCACVDYFQGVLLTVESISGRILGLHGRMVPKRRNGVTATFAQSSNAILLCTDLAARGLDFDNVQLVVQMDAPQDPKNFAHRCGRAGRAGASGKAILFISPGEEAYVELLRNRGVPIEEEVAEIQDRIGIDLRYFSRQNRELYERSVVAFVSYIRFFMEHYCKYIFVFKRMDMVRVMHAFGILSLPKMPELSQFDLSGFQPDPINTDEIPYSDAEREKRRKARLGSKTIKVGNLKRKEPWGRSKERKERKQRRQQKKADKIDPELLKRLQRREERELEKDWREYKLETKRK